MKKIDLGQGAQLLANLGVIAGIVFLAVELRHNNQILIEQARYSMLQNQKDWTFFIDGNEDTARLFYAMEGNAPFSELDQERRTSMVIGNLLTWQWEFEQSRLKLFGDSQLPVETFRFVWRQAHIGELWESVKNGFSPEFVQFIDEEIANQ
jgi:hypothetical protein